MLVDLKRTTAYICPACSNICSQYISVFGFSGSETIPLTCHTHGCRETCVNIKPKRNKYRIEVDECPLCGEKHSYSILRDSFWHKKLVVYKCPVSGINIFYVGEHEEVERALEENEEVYSDVIGGYDEFEGFGDEPPGNELPVHALYAIVDRLHSLDMKDRISCACGSKNIDFNITAGGMELVCLKCGKKKTLEVSDDTLIRLINTHTIIIK